MIEIVRTKRLKNLELDVRDAKNFGRAAFDRCANAETEIAQGRGRLLKQIASAEYTAGQAALHASEVGDRLAEAEAQGGQELAQLRDNVRRIDEVFEMLFDYLGVEIVNKPERITTEDGFVVDVEEAQRYIASVAPIGRKRR